MTTFQAPPILRGQPWSCTMNLIGDPVPDITGADLVVQMRPSISIERPLFQLKIGSGITVIDSKTVQIAASAAQTTLLHSDVAVFTLGRLDGGPRDITPLIKWPVRQGFTR